MPTAIFDIDLLDIPPVLESCNNYNHALILIRIGKEPVGQVRLPLTNNKVYSEEIFDLLSLAIDMVTIDGGDNNTIRIDEHRTVVYGGNMILLQDILDENLQLHGSTNNNSLNLSATIAVCTRDRPDKITSCIEGLLKIPDHGHEVLIIDNCPSTEETYNIVKGYPAITYIREDTPGLNAARNRALKESRGEIVLFNDDDAVPDPDWLSSHLSNFDDPLVMCATGLTMPKELETQAQEWFELYCPFRRGFKKKSFDYNNINPVGAGVVGAGANMSIRKKVLEDIGYFDERFDAGTPTQSGGDTEMFSRIISAGFRIVYDPSALSWHEHKNNVSEFKKNLFGYGVGIYAFWTQRLLELHDITVFKAAWNYFIYYQFKGLLKSLLKYPDSIPAGFILQELKGAISGPLMYFRSHKSLKKRLNGNG